MEGWVTVYTDASWDPKTKVGGWAYMIRSEEGWFKKSGPTPRWVTCSATAEMAAVIAGVYRALREWPETKGVGVRTDCEAAIYYLQYRPYQMNYRRKDWLPVRRMLHRVLSDYDCKIRFVHVKGHQPRHVSKQARLNGNIDYWAGEARVGQFIGQSHEDIIDERPDILGFGLLSGEFDGEFF